MPTIYARETDQRRSVEDLLRKFKRIVEKNGIPSEIRRRGHYEKPSEENKRKLQAAIKRTMKRQLREQARGGAVIIPTRQRRERKRA